MCFAKYIIITTETKFIVLKGLNNSANNDAQFNQEDYFNI